VPNFVSISLFFRPVAAKTPNFAVFWTLAFDGVAIWEQSEKVEHGTQLQTFPNPTASESFLYSNAFVAISCAQTLTFTSVIDRQTDWARQSNFVDRASPV